MHVQRFQNMRYLSIRGFVELISCFICCGLGITPIFGGGDGEALPNQLELGISSW